MGENCLRTLKMWLMPHAALRCKALPNTIKMHQGIKPPFKILQHIRYNTAICCNPREINLLTSNTLQNPTRSDMLVPPILYYNFQA